MHRMVDIEITVHIIVDIENIAHMMVDIENSARRLSVLFTCTVSVVNRALHWESHSPCQKQFWDFWNF